MRPILLVAAASTLLLIGMGCEDFRSFWNRRSLAEDVSAMRDPIFPDERRLGIVGIQRRDELRDPAYVAELESIARIDSAGAVRAQAARALNQARDENARPIFVSLLSDPEPRVQLEAVKALRNLPDESAVPKLVAIAGNDDRSRDVRVWAVAALSSYRKLEVARALVPLLESRDFSVAFEARCSLRRMTGRDYHFEEGVWLKYLSSSATPVLPAPTTSPSK